MELIKFQISNILINKLLVHPNLWWFKVFTVLCYENKYFFSFKYQIYNVIGFGLVDVVDMLLNKLVGEAKSGGGESCEQAMGYPYSSSTGAVAGDA